MVSNRRIDFGQFKGKTLCEIWQHEPSYVSWLYRTFKQRNAWVREEARKLIDSDIDDGVVDDAMDAISIAIIDVLIIETATALEVAGPEGD